jgi:catechol 2,3-dioxygenase-like lactoylglutathione lyase family enzyme
MSAEHAETDSRRQPRWGVGSVHHVVVNVSDLDAALVFYRDGLGLRYDGIAATSGPALERALRLPPGSRSRVAFVRGARGPGRIELVEWSGLQRVDELGEAEVPKALAPGFALMSFECARTELYDLHARLEAKGHKCWSEPQRFSVGPDSILMFAVEDPDGNLLEFFAAEQAFDQ